MKKLQGLCAALLFVLMGVAIAEDAPAPKWALGIWSRSPSVTALTGLDGLAPVPAGETPALSGDAILSNGRFAVVLRRQSGAAEFYSVSKDAPALRASLTLSGAKGVAAEFDRAAIVENAKGAVCIEGFYKTAAGGALSAKFRLKKSDIVLEVEPGAGAEKLRVDCASNLAILPDFFADDIVIHPQKITPNEIEIPSDNFLMQLTGGGDAIVMSVFENRSSDARLKLEGKGEARRITGSEIEFGVVKTNDGTRGGKIWLSLFDGPRIWHKTEIKKADAGKVVPLDWKMPHAAVWRVDFTKSNELTDSWTMLLQEKSGGDYSKVSWLGGGDEKLKADRKRWNTVLGTFTYPAYSDSELRGFLQPLKSDKLSFDGPAVIYPIAPVKQPTRGTFTVFDVIRASLGVGPCEYILDLEGQKGAYKGRATCNTRDTLAGIYKENKQKDKRAQVDKTLDEALAFCTHIRGRIDRYVEFGHTLREYLAEQKKARPELSAYIDEMDKLALEIDARYDARKEKIRTLEYVAQLNTDFRKNVLDDTAPEALEKCKKYGRDLVDVGDNQDELSSECRWVVKSLRQKAGLLLATDPKAAPIANEIRARTQEALKNPANHEGAQH